MKDKQSKPIEKRKVPHLKVRTLWIVGWLITAAALLVFFWPNSENEGSKPPIQSQTPSRLTENAGQERLLGRWVRGDGGYLIEIREASSNGKLNAAYFNPNPINVSRSEWKLKNEKLAIEIELRDTNYPGSLYSLEFLADDRLVGTYYQAVEGTTYTVEFSREN
jgi:hypothetical protein